MLHFLFFLASLPSLFVDMTIQDNDPTVEYFLNCFDKLDYDKSQIQVQVTINNSSEEVRRCVEKWIERKKELYREIAADRRVENKSDYCFVFSSDVFLFPHTLKYLIQKDLPFVAPLLRPISDPGDLRRNFTTDHDYPEIAFRQKLGTFKATSIESAYLVQTKQANKEMEKMICNEREFGFFLHVPDRRAFVLSRPEVEVTRDLLFSILSPHVKDDPSLRRVVEGFPFGDYALYRVQNRDLFFLDEVNDYIKNFVLKQNLNWEEMIQKQFEKYVIPGSVAIDIGGHIGLHSLNLSKLVGERGVVHVFEPQAKMFCELAVNMHLNQRTNVRLHHQALGAEEKWIGMYIPKEEWMKKFPPTLINEGHGTVTDDSSIVDRAKMVRLDDLSLENVSLIKMDVEGYEMQVIRGGLSTIKRNKPVMIIEIAQSPEKPQKIKEIEALGYIHSDLGVDNFLFIPIHMVEREKHVKVVWEGPFGGMGSFSHVNRSMAAQLAKVAEIKLNCVEDGDIKNLPEKRHITIRHKWPPNWQAPKEGKWVLMQPWEYGTLPSEWVEKLQKVDEVWVPTQFVKDEYVNSGIPSEKVVVIPHGVDPKIFHPEGETYKLATNKKFKFLFVGGTIRRKGVDVLVNSFLKSFTAADDVVLVIKDIGCKNFYLDQSQGETIKQIQAWPAYPEIIYLDSELSHEELASLYRACDCLIHPYRGEGFALPVLEAMACGLPVVVTAGGATDDFVTGAFGWFIPASVEHIGHVVDKIKLTGEGWVLEPDGEVLAALMRWIQRHPDEAHSRGVAASQYVLENWTWQRSAQQSQKDCIS